MIQSIRLIFTFSVSLSLASCASPQSIVPKEPSQSYNLSKDEQSFVNESIRKELKDPDSAKFEYIGSAIALNTKRVAVCGRVNSKNSYGGYVGMSPYIGFYVPGQYKAFVLGVIANDQQTAESVLNICREKGIAML